MDHGVCVSVYAYVYLYLQAVTPLYSGVACTRPPVRPSIPVSHAHGLTS